MRILMLGNSFTYYHKLPDLLAEMTGAEVTALTRGGVALAEHNNPETELGASVAKALAETKWDYVVLQEQSAKPAKKPQLYLEAIQLLGCAIRENGATPVVYASWAYEDNSEKLADTGFSQMEMDQLLAQAFDEAAAALACPLAPVGKAFSLGRDALPLYLPDHFHPSHHGSYLATAVLCETMGFPMIDTPFLDVSPEDRAQLTKIAHQACVSNRKVDQP